MSNRRRNKTGIRWDKIIGLVTIVTIIVCAWIVYCDFKKANTEETSANVAESNNNETKTQAQKQDTSSKITVCIDAGHGGSDAGTDYNGKKEKEQTLEMALLVEKELSSRGINVVMTRTTDTDVSLDKRIEICNSSNAAAIVSIHRNSYKTGGTASGVEAWIHSSNPTNAGELGNSILKKLTALGVSNRGVKTGTMEDSKSNYRINSKCKCTSIILELGFMNNSSDNALVTTKKEAAAKAVSDGIIDYLEQAGYING